MIDRQREGILSKVNRTYDILGNTTAKGSTSMGWDCLNRMTSLGSNSYVYRTDGMRVSKTVGSTTTTYRYDGQMPIESYDGSTLTQNFLGARGIDAVISGSGSSYPIYDGHGNNVATLSKSGGGYAVSNRVSYDAWGGIRSGSTTSSSRYCANLGHQADDESGLTYMRARYYDASSGRFISEDESRHGSNWFQYAAANPINSIDFDGKADVWISLLFGLASMVMTGILASLKHSKGIGIACIVSFISGTMTAAALDEVDAAFALQGLDATLASFGVGGGINAIATMLVDLLTGSTDNIFSDMALAFLCGGVGGACGGMDGGVEIGDALMGGAVMGILQGLAS